MVFHLEIIGVDLFISEVVYQVKDILPTLKVKICSCLLEDIKETVEIREIETTYVLCVNKVTNEVPVVLTINESI